MTGPNKCSIKISFNRNSCLKSGLITIFYYTFVSDPFVIETKSFRRRKWCEGWLKPFLNFILINFLRIRLLCGGEKDDPSSAEITFPNPFTFNEMSFIFCILKGSLSHPFWSLKPVIEEPMIYWEQELTCKIQNVKTERQINTFILKPIKMFRFHCKEDMLFHQKEKSSIRTTLNFKWEVKSLVP